jgi:hypothetical protein
MQPSRHDETASGFIRASLNLIKRILYSKDLFRFVNQLTLLCRNDCEDAQDDKPELCFSVYRLACWQILYIMGGLRFFTMEHTLRG